MFTGFHIHDAPAGVNGPVIINTGIGGGANAVPAVPTGSGNLNYTVLATPDDATFPAETPPITGLNASGIARVGVHTMRNADGTVAGGAVIFDVNIERLVTIDPGPQLNTLATIRQNPENAYINLHTTVNPGGAVRSQLAPANTALPAIGAVTSNPDSKTITLAPLYFVSPGQINAQAPVNLAPGRQVVVVTTANGASTAFGVPIVMAAPAIYLADAVLGTGAILKNKDFSLVSAANPAKAGDVVLIDLTGLGETTPALQTGNLQPGTTLNNTGPVTVTIGGQNAPVIYSIASPGSAGLYQIAVTGPSGVTGSADVVVNAGTATSNTVKMAVE